MGPKQIRFLMRNVPWGAARQAIVHHHRRCCGPAGWSGQLPVPGGYS